MRKLKLLMVACTLLLGAGQTWGQTDVTSTYLTNAGFDVTSDFITANKTTSSNSDVSNWTKSGNEANSCGAVVAYGSSYTLNGKTIIGVDKFGKNSGGALGISTGWGQSVTYTQAVTLPAGEYKITFDIINVNGSTGVATPKFGWEPSGGSAVYTTRKTYEQNVWYTDAITFTLNTETEGNISVGGIMGNGKSNECAVIFVDNVKIFKMDEASAPTIANPIDYSDLINQTTWSVQQDDNVTPTTSSTLVTNITSGDWTGRYTERYRGMSGHYGKALYQTVSVPAGVYQVQAACMSSSANNVDAAAGKVDGDVDVAYFYANNEELTYPLSDKKGYYRKHIVTLDADGTIEFGINTKVVGANWNAIGCATVVKVANSYDDYIEDLLSESIAAWNTAHTSLEALDATLLPDAAESAITTELEKARPNTKETIESATAALQALIDSYAGIKASYDKVLALIDFVTEEKTNSTGTKTTIEAAISTATTNIETRTTASALDSDYSTLETARQTYVTSGAQPTADNVFDYTFKISDATVTGNGSWSNKGTANGQQYTGAPDNKYMDCGWNSTFQSYQTVSDLPAGYYTLKAATRANSSYITAANIYVNQDRSALNRSTDNHKDGNTGGTLGNGWSWTEVNFELRATGSVSVGFYAQTTSTGWAGADDFHLYYKGNAVDDETADALKATVVDGKMNATAASTQASALSTFESEQTIENYEALEVAIAAASASKTAYANLKTELDKMDVLFGSLETNVYSATDYATNYTNVKDSYDDSSISTDDANAYSYGSRVTGAMPAIMLSAWKVGETAALTDASLYMNTWSTEGNSDGSDVTTPFYEYWVADGNALTAKTFTATVEGLTAGTNYLVTAKVRVRQQDNQPKADDDVTFQVNDEEVATAADGTQSNVRPEMYYKTVRAFGKADNDGKLTIKVVVKNGNHISWLAFKDVHYSEVTNPTDDHKSDLASAISTAESKTIGFAEGEYAPYTNIDARKALVAAKAINDNVNNYTDYEVVAATTALTGATWDDNDEEMNAVSNELFSGTEYGTAGWTQNVTWNNVGGDGSYSIPAGTMTYGTIAYHEMPLKAATIYTLSFGHRTWDGSGNPDNGGTVSVLNENSDGLAATSYTGTSATTLQTETIDFLTGDAGNYTFTISAASGRLTFGNVTIKQAVAKPITISEEATSAPVFWLANATLTRTLSASYWNTFSVPFDMNIPDGWTVKEFKSAEENVITFGNAESIKAGKPYLVKPADNVVNPAFNGVIVKNTEGETVGEGDYKFAAQIYNKALATNGTIAYLSTNGMVKKLTSGGLKGLRAYFIIPAGAEARIAFLDDETTGITEMKQQSNSEEQVIYDLNGRRVQNMQKGIYIVNGKKIVK